MIKSTNAYQILSIFTNDKKVFYDIPKYQREYTWGSKEWDALFNDIVSNEPGYFLGSIICVDSSSSALGDTHLQIIDGQQRITSLSLLLLAIYVKLSSYKEILTENQLDKLKSIKKELIIIDDEDEISIPRLTPQSQGLNKEDYFSILCEYGLMTGIEKVNYAGLRRNYKAFNFFTSQINKYIEEEKLENPDAKDVQLIFGLANKVNKSIMVSIEVETNKDAYMLFESLNNRGVPLSAIDLIKNLLISVSDDPKNKKMAENCYQQWTKILKYLGDDYTVQERFFRQYYNAYREELNKGFESSGKKYTLGYLATKSTLLDIYEKLIRHDYRTFLNNIEKEAKVYSVIINNAIKEDTISEFLEPLTNLERIQGAPSYLLLMYLLSNKDALQISNENLVDIINYLTKFFVRRNITDFPNTRNLNKIFMSIVEDVHGLLGDDVINKVLLKLKENSSDDETFEKKLRGPLYLSNTDSTRFLLCYYEDKFKTNEIHSDLWKRDNSNKYIWTIEHIFPEGENIPKCWIDMIANGDSVLAKEYWNNYVHTLGNLTITGYNSNLSNMSFIDKKNRKKDEKFIGYMNGLKLNEDVVSEEIWTKDKIVSRTNKLVKVFLEEFEL